jgi:hypothetical protein
MGSRTLRKRCPICKRVRKFAEPPGDQGGEPHPRRPNWWKVPGGYLVCGWCVLTAAGIPHKGWWKPYLNLQVDDIISSMLSEKVRPALTTFPLIRP